MNVRKGWVIVFLLLFIIPFCDAEGRYKKKITGFKAFSLGTGGFFYNTVTKEVGDVLFPEVRILYTFFDPGIGVGLNIGGYRFSLASDDYKDYFIIMHPYLVFSKHVTSFMQVFLYGGGGFVRYQCVSKICEDTQPAEGWGSETEAGVGLSLAHFLSLDSGIKWQFMPSPFENRLYVFFKVNLGYFNSRYREVEIPELAIKDAFFVDENGDGILEPGEKGILRVAVENQSDLTAENVRVYISPTFKDLFKYMTVKDTKIELEDIEGRKYKEAVFYTVLKNTVSSSEEFMEGEYTIYVDVKAKGVEKVTQEIKIRISKRRLSPEKPVSPALPKPPEEVSVSEVEEETKGSSEEIPFPVTVTISRVYLDDYTGGDGDGILELNEDGYVKFEIEPPFPEGATIDVTLKEKEECIQIYSGKVKEEVGEENRVTVAIPLSLKKPCSKDKVTFHFVLSFYPEKGKSISAETSLSLQVQKEEECVVLERGKCWVYMEISGVSGRERSLVSTEAHQAVLSRMSINLLDKELLENRIEECSQRVSSERLSQIRTRLDQLKFLGVRWLIEISVSKRSDFLQECIVVNGSLKEIMPEMKLASSSHQTQCSLFEVSDENIRRAVRYVVLELLNYVECD